PASTGARTVAAIGPTIGTKLSMIRITMYSTVITIQMSGAAAKMCQPRLHHSMPSPAGTDRGDPPDPAVPAAFIRSGSGEAGGGGEGGLSMSDPRRARRYGTTAGGPIEDRFSLAPGRCGGRGAGSEAPAVRPCAGT